MGSFSLSHQAVRLISIVREEKSLVALLNYPQLLEKTSGSKAALETQKVDWANFYEFKKYPLKKIPQSLSSFSEQLDKSWEALSRARYLDNDTLEDLLFVLLHSVPAHNASQVPLQALELKEKGSSFTPTAARPRASKGTKDRPRKTPQPEPTDLRPYLSSRDGSQRVLKYFQALLPHGLTHLAKTGVLSSEQKHAMKSADPIPFLALPGLHQSELKEELRRLPSAFLQHLLPGMEMKCPKEIRELLSLFHHLQLGENNSLLAAVSRLVCREDNIYALPWCKVVVQQPQKRRAAFIVHLMNSKCLTCAPNSELDSALREMNDLSSEQNYDGWMNCFLRGWRRGVSKSYLLAGFRLASQFYPNCKFGEIRQCTEFPSRLIEDLACYFSGDEGASDGYRILRLWERSSQVNQFTNVLKTTKWFDLSPENAYQYAAMILDFCWYFEDSRYFRQHWNIFREELPQIERIVKTVPQEFQWRAINEIRGIALMGEVGVGLRVRLQQTYRLISRICRRPYDPDVDASMLTGAFFSVPSKRFVNQFLHAPDASFHALDNIAQRNNVERLVAYGLNSLIKTIPEFTVRCFERFPRHLFKACQALGCLSYPIRATLIRDLQDHVLFTSELEHLPIRKACEQILTLCEAGLWNPLPHYLRRWMGGKYQLTPERIARYFQICFEQLDRTRLDLLEQKGLEILCHGLPNVSLQGAARHAVQLIGAMDRNRKGLRRFLAAYWSGNFGYLEDHPATQAWLRKHSRINLGTWKKGLRLSRCVGKKTIELKMEEDPLEVLKMGTYVGSCLSLGGIYADSAAAVLLDVNKQVVYARDPEGRVVGRQLIAISKKDQLVCFEVYPKEISPRLLTWFRQYDIALAKAMGLEIYRAQEEENEVEDCDYIIEHILSEDWWDDGAWDMQVPSKVGKAKKKPKLMIFGSRN